MSPSKCTYYIYDIDKHIMDIIIALKNFQVLIHHFYQQGKPSRPHVRDRSVTLLKYVLLTETVYKEVLVLDMFVSTGVL